MADATLAPPHRRSINAACPERTHGAEIRACLCEGETSGGGAEGGDGIQLFSIIQNAHIKGRSGAALHNSMASEIRSGTKRHIGMHDFYQFNY